MQSVSALRPTPALVAAAFLAVLACDDPTDSNPLGGNAVLDGGVLTVRGGGTGSHIVVRHSATGVDVERDGSAARFTEPVTAIRVLGGAGDDVVRYDQTVVADLELTITLDEGDDDVVASFAPSGSGTEMTVVADVRTGAGSDRMDIRWDGRAVPALNTWVRLKGETQGPVQELPEVEDEVLVEFEHGDPDRPVVVGMVWNARDSSPPSTGADASGVAVDLDFREGKADAHIDVVGGSGRDSVEVSADYSGVTLQQGRITVDADLNEGDNHAGKYIITAATHTFVDARVAAGDGNNVVELEDVLGGDGERTYAIELGDGDNQTAIRFGDGSRGRRPVAGTRNVTATYRSGAGTNGVILTSEVVEPLVSDVTIDYGTGPGDTYGRYKVQFPWDVESGSGDIGPAYGASLAVTSPAGSGLDLRVDVGDPDMDDPTAFGVVTATGRQVQESDLQFIHRLAEHSTTSEVEREWEMQATGLAIADSGSLLVDVPPGLDRLVYLQNDLAVAQGATMEVTLAGAAAPMLAHLLGVSGAGQYGFLADGGTEGELVAVLTRDLTATDAAFDFKLSGGGGDDVLGLARPAEIVPGAPIRHALAGGDGIDTCYAPQDVAVTGCEQLEAIGDPLLRMIETTFGTALADVWRQ